MDTEKQGQANQGNTKKGGVKTGQGKAIGRYNALKHDLLSDKVLLRDNNGSDKRTSQEPSNQPLVQNRTRNIIDWQDQYKFLELGIATDVDIA